MAYMGVHVSRRLKEELARAIDKWLQVINNIYKLLVTQPLFMATVISASRTSAKL